MEEVTEAEHERTDSEPESEATTLTAILYDQDELKEKDILEYLRDIKMEG